MNDSADPNRGTAETEPSAAVRALAAPLLARLKALGIEARTRWHAPVFTVDQGRHLHAETPGAHTKNLFVKDKKGRLFLLVCDEASIIDLKGVHRLIGAQGRVSFAGPETMMEHLGVTPGSVTAFAAMNDAERRVSVVLDAALLAFDIINCHPLTNAATTSIARDDLLTFLSSSGHRPLIVDFRDAPSGGIENGQGS